MLEKSKLEPIKHLLMGYIIVTANLFDNHATDQIIIKIKKKKSKIKNMLYIALKRLCIKFGAV